MPGPRTAFDAIPARARAVLVALGLLLAIAPAAAERPQVHAIVGAHIVTAPGQEIDTGTIVIRDGLIEAVGAAVTVPADAVELAGDGLWIYPGFIDPETTLAQQQDSAGDRGGAGGGSPFGRAPERTSPGAVHPLELVRPETRASQTLLPFDGDRKREAERYREQGITAVLTAPESGVFRGSGAVILLADDTPVPELILRDDVAQHIGFQRGRFGRGYPTSLMGAVATIRQVLLDAQRHAEWTARYAKHPRGMTRPEHVAAYEALSGLVAGTQAAVFHAESPADVLLAHRLAEQFGLRAVVAGSGHEWEIAGAVAATRRSLILPLGFPDKPEVDEVEEALNVPLETLRRYTGAAAGPGRLHQAGVPFAFTTRGLKTLSDFRKHLRKIVEAGLPENAALAALTTVPAQLLGIDAMAGTLERGKIANLVVLDGPLLGEESNVRHVFVDGVQYRMKEKKLPKGADPDAVVDPRGEWTVLFEFGARTMERKWTIGGERGAYTGTAETQSGTVSFESVKLEGNVLTVIFPARGGRGPSELTVVIQGDSFEGSLEMGPRSAPVKGTRVGGPQGGAR